MGIVRKIVGGRRVTEVVEAVRALDEVMPPVPAEKTPARPAPKKKPGDAKIARGLGERLGIAGLVLATVLAVGAGLAGCNETTARPTPTASCEEDQPCWDCRTMGNGRCSSQPPAVKATCAEPASWCGRTVEAVQR